MIPLSSLSQLYDHIVTIMLYGKETSILKEVMTTILSNEIRKRSNQEGQEGSDLMVTKKKERGEGKKSLGSSKACHFCHGKGHWKNDCKHWLEWLKKKSKLWR